MPSPRRLPAAHAILVIALAAMLAACSGTSASASPSAVPSAGSTAAAPSPSSIPSTIGASALPSASAMASVPGSASAPPSGSAQVSVPPSVHPSASIPSADASGVHARLPVVTCTVVDGAIQGPLPTPMVTSLDVTLPAELAARLVVYGIENEQLIVGPRDWRCTGLVGADGSSHVTIVNPADPTMGIVVDSAPGAPYSGVLDLACPLFADADQLLHSTFGFDCPKQHAPAEQVTMQGGDIARFVDPPGVKAVGALSGGTVPVRGALIYHKATDNAILAFQISCALPESEGAICGVVIDDWIARVAAAYDVAL